MSWSGASNRHDIESCLRRMGGQDDAEIDVAEAALLLAALNRPQLGLERYRHHLSLLTRDIAELAGRQGAADRKSVVKGKRVSGRVDRGGRRIINKKKTH